MLEVSFMQKTNRAFVSRSRAEERLVQFFRTNPQELDKDIHAHADRHELAQKTLRAVLPYFGRLTANDFRWEFASDFPTIVISSKDVKGDRNTIVVDPNVQPDVVSETIFKSARFVHEELTGEESKVADKGLDTKGYFFLYRGLNLAATEFASAVALTVLSDNRVNDIIEMLANGRTVAQHVKLAKQIFYDLKEGNGTLDGKRLSEITFGNYATFGSAYALLSLAVNRMDIEETAGKLLGRKVGVMAAENLMTVKRDGWRVRAALAKLERE